MTLEFLTKPDTQQFIQEHLDKDVSELMLRPPSRFSPEEIKWIADQILARQKAKGKLPSWVDNQALVFPPPLSVEQASSEVTATYKASLLEGDLLIDLTGGTGIDLLALGKRFKKAVYVEEQKWLADVFQVNCDTLGQSVEIHNETATKFLNSFQKKHYENISIYLDPARRDRDRNKVFRLEDCSPNVIELLPILRQKADQVLIKLAPLLDIKEAIQQLQFVKEVHVVSAKNDCKELLFLLDFSFEGTAKIITINLEGSDPNYLFSYDLEESRKAKISEPLKFLCEPNSSILKAGAFRSIAADFDVGKISPNTHLYTSNEAVKNWPGKVFEVVEMGVNKKTLSKYLENGCINVLVRNYPIGATELKKKLKLKDGGSYFLIAFRDQENQAQLCVATRIGRSVN